MDGPCQCGHDFPPGKPTYDQLRSALAKSLLEADCYRIMLDLPAFDGNRTFSEQDLSDGSLIGLNVKIRDGELICRPES